MSCAAEGKFEVEVRAKTRAVDLRVRLRGASLWSGAPVSGSVRASILALLQVLRAPSSTDSTSRRHSTSSTEVRYSLRIRLRKLWFRIRGKHATAQVSNRPLTTPIQQKKPKWRRTFSSVSNRLLQRSKSSEKSVTAVVSQEAAKESGFVAQYVDALGAGRVAMAVHGVGMACTVIVLVQLAGARGLPLFVVIVTGLAIVGRVVFVHRYSALSPWVQQLWQEAVSIGGISLVPQALGAMFRANLPQSGFTASEGIMGILTLIMILLARSHGLPFKVMQFVGVVSAGIPAILVLWAPIVQLWTCWWSPAAVNSIQVLTGLLAVLSNCILGYSRR